MRRNAEKDGDKTAVVFGGEAISWRELWERVQMASGNLASHILSSRQQIVAILEPNSVDFVAAYVAIVHAGHIALPLDITFKKLELDSVIKAVKPDLVVARNSFSHLIDVDVLHIEDLFKAGEKDIPPPLRLSPEEQVATIFLSSGTTGKPKAVPNTHSNIIWDIKAISGPMGWSEDDTLLITLHMSHRHGLVICLLGAIYHGNTVYLEERFNPQKTLDMLESGKISLYSAVPSIYDNLVGFEPDKRYDLSKVRLFASSSSPLPPYLRKHFKKRFDRDILDRYGTSETGSIAIRQPAEPDVFGDLLEGVQIRLEPNGEVALKSPGLFPGYYLDPQATKRHTTRDGWWLTGDLGLMHGGKIVLKGRSSQRIIRSGYSIYPQDIEWALSQNPKVEEVSVVSLHPKDHVDDKVVAFYSGSAATEDVEEYSKTNLPRSWRPDAFVKLSELPKGRTNKVQLSKLKDMAGKYV